MKNILIVDDFIEYRYEYKSMLEEFYHVELAENVEEAKTKLDNQFHLALIDINLDRFDRSNKDGILLAHWIKENLPGLKIILVSAFFPESEVEEVYDSFIQKPIIEHVIREEVKQLIGL
ncbi:MAG: response regulator [Candidatus Aminicenantes bacterium]|jgi:CheY-like chemotaxis protein